VAVPFIKFHDHNNRLLKAHKWCFGKKGYWFKEATIHSGRLLLGKADRLKVKAVVKRALFRLTNSTKKHLKDERQLQVRIDKS
jgi:hypothetical protein